MVVVYKNPQASKDDMTGWRAKTYDVKLGKTCWTCSEENRWARLLDSNCANLNAFLLKMAVENVDVYTFSDDWLKKMRILDSPDGLSEDDYDWPEFVELDMLKPMRTA